MCSYVSKSFNKSDIGFFCHTSSCLWGCWAQIQNMPIMALSSVGQHCSPGYTDWLPLRILVFGLPEGKFRKFPAGGPEVPPRHLFNFPAAPPSPLALPWEVWRLLSFLAYE